MFSEIRERISGAFVGEILKIIFKISVILKYYLKEVVECLRITIFF